jgi:hypothetical protein
VEAALVLAGAALVVVLLGAALVVELVGATCPSSFLARRASRRSGRR